MKKWSNGAKNKKFVASYSGGKDSTLALYKAMQEGTAIGIIVMMEEDGERSRAHSLFPSVLKAQAEAIGLPLFTAATNWEDYEKVFVKKLKEAKDLGYDAKSSKFPLGGNGRALSLNKPEGFVRLISDKNTNELLGAQIVGVGASDVIAELALALEQGLTVEDISLTIHSHPSLAEQR